MSTIPEVTTSGDVRNRIVSVVLPCYNEARNIQALVDELEAVRDDMLWSSEIIWVNDGSTDETAELINTAAAAHEYHRAVHLRQNSGQSAALAAGFDEAEGDFIVPMDGDGQNDPQDIPRLVDTLVQDDYDCVSGNRADRDDSLGKRIPSAIQTRMTRSMCPDVEDFGCTLKAYRAEVLEDIQLRGEHHRYIPAKLAARGYRLTDVDVNHRERAHGDTKYGVGRLIKGFLDGVYHLMMTRYGARPIHFFGLIGILMFAVGGLLGGHMLLERLVLQNPISQHLPRLIAIAVLVLGGLLFFMLGILSELLTQLLYQDERPYRIDRVVR